MALKSLESTFIYKHLNKSNNITKSISAAIAKGTPLTEQNLEEAFITIIKNYKYPLKHKVVDEFRKGNMVLMYSPNNVKIPQFIPFILTGDAAGNIVPIVFVDVWADKMNEENGNVKIDPKKLYTMMEAAYLSKVCYINSKQIGSKPPIIINGSAIWSMMFTKVLNRKYALNIDKTKYHKVLFLSSKFFIINILGVQDSDTVFNYCLKNCPNANLFSIKEINDVVPDSAYTSIEAFIKTLADPKTGLNMKGLNVRNYLEAYINMYDSSNLLSLESFPHFLYNVNAVTNSSYINNQYVMEEIVEKHGAKLYTAMMALTE